MEENRIPRSAMRGWQYAAAIGWLPVHVLGLPLLLALLFPRMSAANLNFWVFALGAGLLTLLCLDFLRRDFDRLWDAPVLILGQAILGFALLLAANYVLGLLMNRFLPDSNPNNQAILDLAKKGRARITVTAVVLAPILEELMFRGGIFGLIRRKSRVAAYAVSLLVFALYHTWVYALADPVYWLCLFQYLPAGFLLCWIYDRNDCIWASILMHAINNGVSLLMMWMGVA